MSGGEEPMLKRVLDAIRTLGAPDRRPAAGPLSRPCRGALKRMLLGEEPPLRPTDVALNASAGDARGQECCSEWHKC